MSNYYCPYCDVYYLLNDLPSDMCCHECGTTLEYDEEHMQDVTNPDRDEDPSFTTWVT
jgi:rubredoxin